MMIPLVVLEQALHDLHDWWLSIMAWFSNSTAAMDMQTAIICVVVFVVSAIVVYLISVFGMRERTYEEAIEEQRRRNQEAILQSKTDKGKKEKKYKKWGKKMKEKPEDEKPPSCEEEGKATVAEIKADVETNSSSSHNAEAKSNGTKKKTKHIRRVVLVDKSSECTQQQSSSDDTDDHNNSPACSVETDVKGVTATEEQIKLSFKQDPEEQTVEEVCQYVKNEEESKITSFSEAEKVKIRSVRKSPVRKSKKVKSEIAELGPELADLNGNKILAIIKSSALAEEEIQHIVEVLSSKQKGSHLEKRKSELALLKKQMQEKEDMILNEQKLCNSANERIKDLIQDLNEEKARALVSEKSLRDVLHQEQQEIKALHGMMQRKREQHTSELSALQSKMQQMKNKLKEDHALAMQRLQDENTQFQTLSRIESEKQQRSSMELSRLQHEIDQLRSSHEKYDSHQAAMQQTQEDLHRQIQQLETHIEQLVASHQEEEYSYKQRINEMSNKLQQAENARAGLVQELQKAQSVCGSLEADNGSLRQRFDEVKHQLNGSEQDLMQLQTRLEESHKQQRDLASCLENMRSEVMDLTNVKLEQLQNIQNLKQEKESLVAQLSQSIERISAVTSEKQQKSESLEKESRLIEKKEHDAIIQEKDSILHHLIQELEQSKSEIANLSKEIESQKRRNKELSENSREMTEALNVAEKNAENKLQEVLKTAEKKIEDAQSRAEDRTKEMQNLLNEQIKEVERALQERYSKELENSRLEVESAEKEAENRVIKAQSQADLRVEEFQESLYRRLGEVNCEAEARIDEALQEKQVLVKEIALMCATQKEMLTRIFPDIQIDDKLEHKDWLCQFEREAKVQGEKSSVDFVSSTDEKELDKQILQLKEALAGKEKLESQIKSYETLLAETEFMLKNLESRAEKEEEKWKSELLAKEEDLSKLLKKNKILEDNLGQLHGLKEALYEIEELRQKLQNEEHEKKLLKEKLGLLDSLTNSSSISTNNSFSEVNSNNLPLKTEKKKKSRKRGASGKK